MAKKIPLFMRSAQPPALQAGSIGAGRILHYLIIPSLYVALWLFFLKYYQHIYYKDEISFISIAEKYARGDLIHAVNSYWSPFLSWLLAPLLFLEVPYDIAAKLLSFVIGIFVFLGFRTLSYAFDLSERVRNTLLLLLIPTCVYCSLCFFSPDFLLAGVLSFYFSIILRRDYASKWYAGWLSGVLGAVAYFTKGYAFYFFVAHFVMANIIHFWGSDRRTVVKHCAAGLAVFFALSAIWVGLLYQKYHEVTIGITGKYNYAIVSPHSKGRPIFYVGFLPPADATATSIWEDPYYFPPIEPWNLFESREAFTHQLRLIWKNVKLTVLAFERFSVFSLPIIVASLVFCFVSLKVLRNRIPTLVSLGTLALYSAGYWFIHSEERYLWPMLPLLVFMGGHLLQLLFRSPVRGAPVAKAILVVVLGASFMVAPLKELLARPAGRPTTDTLGRLLEGKGLEDAKIASNKDYGATVCIAHHVRARYYGQPKEGTPEEQVIRELQDNGIDFYLVWDGAGIERKDLEKTDELRSGRRILSIYSVHKREGSLSTPEPSPEP